MSGKRSFALTSTTSIQAVSSYDVDVTFDHVLVDNTTDGDVEIYFGQQSIDLSRPDLVVSSSVQIVLDDFVFKGQAYYKNSTGTGGPLKLTVWRTREVY